MIGIDVVAIRRIEDLSEHARKRIFHPEELAQAERSPRPGEFLAGRFAVKEAFFKAVGNGMKTLSTQDVWTTRGEHGEPVINLSSKARALTGGRTVTLSISHDDPVAVAVVLISGGNDGAF
ncbi:MAG: Holo-(acyl-carrier-protein) synthase [Spirochaetes bacterium ADurb.Bin315]|nr:holo-ACP synthase [Spirochaetota bacterium]NLL25186.1 holo-ACP synthase [Spirochaetales bacterium]OQA44677.1 MAG: Holo-(acyl-carrier-protein) synthase [Spirochaetes bacterium ADurb.Bin315]TAH57195.1 MAG: holo-[acyl-carrier-protein] synthase [Sphaerochaeta sp.]